MLSVTQSALERLSRKLSKKDAADDVALRFTRRAGGWKLRLDREAVGDTAFAHEGRKVLLLDEDASKAMTDMTLDTRKDAPRARLRLYRSRHQQG